MQTEDDAGRGKLRERGRCLGAAHAADGTAGRHVRNGGAHHIVQRRIRGRLLVVVEHDHHTGWQTERRADGRRFARTPARSDRCSGTSLGKADAVGVRKRSSRQRQGSGRDWPGRHRRARPGTTASGFGAPRGNWRSAWSYRRRAGRRPRSEGGRGFRRDTRTGAAAPRSRTGAAC